MSFANAMWFSLKTNYIFYKEVKEFKIKLLCLGKSKAENNDFFPYKLNFCTVFFCISMIKTLET